MKFYAMFTHAFVKYVILHDELENADQNCNKRRSQNCCSLPSSKQLHPLKPVTETKHRYQNLKGKKQKPSNIESDKDRPVHPIQPWWGRTCKPKILKIKPIIIVVRHERPVRHGAFDLSAKASGNRVILKQPR